jgi:hypothetical protein
MKQLPLMHWWPGSTSIPRNGMNERKIIGMRDIAGLG